VDWGDGITETFAYPSSGTFTETHTYLDGLHIPSATIYTATLTLSDDDTGQDTGTVNALVENVPPAITSLAVTSPVDENGTATLTGTFTDPGTLDTFTLLIDWGDGTASETFPYPAGTTTFSETHAYLDDNPTATPSDVYSVTVTLTDDEGGAVMTGTAVTINNLAPLVEAGVAQVVADTAPVTFTGVFTDAGTLDTHTVLWNFGDGLTTTGTLTPTHTFPGVGTYTVTLTVTDDDTGVGTDTLTVTVLPATDLSLTKQALPGPILSGADVVYTLTVSNLGPSDALNVVITDPLPAGMTFVDSVGCLENVGIVTCTLTDLAQGDSLALTVTATVGLEVNGIITNTASVTSASADPDLTNNTASAPLEAVSTLIVFEDDFENPPIQPEWGCATPVTSTTPQGNRNFLGEFGAETVCLTLADLPQHAYVQVAFDLYLIRSWDGNLMEMPANLRAYALEEVVGPDVWSFVADGDIQLATTFANWEFFRQAYPGAYPGGDYVAWTGASEVKTLGYMFYDIPLDSVYHLVFTLPHTGESLDLEFISEQLQGVLDESWGLDNVVVTISMTDQFGTTYPIFLPIIVR
jgi:uncharacterized repeat protein (TIGR01451 family)